MFNNFNKSFCGQKLRQVTESPRQTFPIIPLLYSQIKYIIQYFHYFVILKKINVNLIVKLWI